MVIAGDWAVPALMESRHTTYGTAAGGKTGVRGAGGAGRLVCKAGAGDDGKLVYEVRRR